MLQELATTIPCEMRDFHEWHRGRESYAAWVLLCENNGQLLKEFTAAREYLNGYLVEPYIRQPHITLYTCGFIAEDPKYDDDFTQDQIERQIQALEKANIGSFEIETGGIKSFGSAPFFEIHDPDKGINRIRSALENSAREFRTVPYQPHLTIGLYSDAFPSEKVLAHIAAFEKNPVRLKVNEIVLVTYRAADIAGELAPRYSYGLSM